jgi:hypothetical protein
MSINTSISVGSNNTVEYDYPKNREKKIVNLITISFNRHQQTFQLEYNLFHKNERGLIGRKGKEVKSEEKA